MSEFGDCRTHNVFSGAGGNLYPVRVIEIRHRSVVYRIEGRPYLVAVGQNRHVSPALLSAAPISTVNQHCPSQ